MTPWRLRRRFKRWLLERLFDDPEVLDLDTDLVPAAAPPSTDQVETVPAGSPFLGPEASAMLAGPVRSSPATVLPPPPLAGSAEDRFSRDPFFGESRRHRLR